MTARAAGLLLLLAGCEEPAPPPPVAGGMVSVPAGSFTREGRVVRVSAFLMDRLEVTQADYEKLKLPNPSPKKGPTLPVHMVTWVMAARYCNERSRAEGLEPCYDEDTGACDFSRPGYRLPTEAEWEYACRAGGEPRDLAWHAGNSGRKIHPVGTRSPNAWGLHDMQGNAAEWCNDAYGKGYYATAPEEDPPGPDDGTHYVVRGGSYLSTEAALAPSARAFETPGFADACLAPETLGFRCVRRPRAPTAFLYDPLYLEHKTGEGFPERPARIEAIAARLKERGLTEKMLALKAVPAADEWILTIHKAGYMDRVRKQCAEVGVGVGQVDIPDVPISARSYEVAVAAVGGVLGAVDAVMEKRARNAFCAVRPPGHHAGPAKAMGFCIFNNVALAAKYIQSKHKLAKVLIVDWDVHHGNGTQDAFYEDGGVMYFSTHLGDFYPGTGTETETGAGKGAGLIINVPLAKGAGDAEVLKAYEEKLKPAALKFKPDFVLISCGFDSHENDTLGKLAITSAGFGKMTRVVKGIADECCGGRLVSVLEGGYNLDNLANASEAHVRALME